MVPTIFHRKFHGVLLVPHNSIMDMHNVVPFRCDNSLKMWRNILGDNFCKVKFLRTLALMVSKSLYKCYDLPTTLHSPITMGHIHYYSRKLMWMIILFCATFVLYLIFNVLVTGLHEDLGEDQESWNHIISTLTRKLFWPTLIISTLIFHPQRDYLVYLYPKRELLYTSIHLIHSTPKPWIKNATWMFVFTQVDTINGLKDPESIYTNL